MLHQTFHAHHLRDHFQTSRCQLSSRRLRRDGACGTLPCTTPTTSAGRSSATMSTMQQGRSRTAGSPSRVLQGRTRRISTPCATTPSWGPTSRRRGGTGAGREFVTRGAIWRVGRHQNPGRGSLEDSSENGRWKLVRQVRRRWSCCGKLHSSYAWRVGNCGNSGMFPPSPTQYF